MDGTVLPTLPDLKLFSLRDKVDSDIIVTEWLTNLQACFDLRKFENLSELFIEGCWWRDILALGWDFTTKQGQENIDSYLSASKISVSDLKASSSGGLKPALIEWAGQAWVQAAFTFQTVHGKCHGLVRLENDAAMNWKAWTVFTELQELHYQRDLDVRRRQSRAAVVREPHTNGNHASEDADVLIVGAGK